MLQMTNIPYDQGESYFDSFTFSLNVKCKVFLYQELIHFFKDNHNDIPMSGHEIQLPLIGRQETVIFKAMFHVTASLIIFLSLGHINVTLIVPSGPN